MCEESTAPSSLRGKVALVTGGTGSIGWACAKQLAEAGCHVALVDLDLARCEELAAQLPTKSIGVAFDVSSEPAVVAGVASISERLGGVDILVNVAGILSNNKCFETSAEEWRKVHAVNYDGAFFLSKACLPHMVEQGWGRVVNLSSWAWKSGGITAALTPTPTPTPAPAPAPHPRPKPNVHPKQVSQRARRTRPPRRRWSASPSASHASSRRTASQSTASRRATSCLR
jgi:nucleoside-diphosphate-sugar epimerase